MGGNSLTYYHSPTHNSGEWDLVNDTSEYDLSSLSYSDNSTSHYYLTPVIFRAHSSEIPFPRNASNLISGPDSHEKFYVSSGSLEYSIPDTFTNDNGDIFKLRQSNRLGRYYEYFRNLLDIVKKAAAGAEPLDILMVTIAYAAMLFAVVQLFYEMRRAGSKFWLAFGSILSSVIAFLVAVVIVTEVFGIELPLSSLTEGIPFLVATLGFRHKISYTIPIVDAIRGNPKSDISDVVGDTVMKKVAAPLIKQQLIIAFGFLAISLVAPTLTGLRNFCILISVLMIVDLFITFTFYSAVISLKSQINTVHKQIELREALEEEGVSEDVARFVANADTVSQEKKLLFKHNRSIWAFKVLMVAGFIGLHLFALGTSWLYDDLSDYKSTSTSILKNTAPDKLPEFISDVLPIGTNGTIVTLMPTEIYRRVTLLTHLEDLLFDIISRVSLAIRDPYISKFLFMVAGISLAINVYLLNVARNHLFVQAHSSKEKPKNKKVEETIPVKKAPVKEAKKDVVVASAAIPDNVKDYEIVEDGDETVRPLSELVDIFKSGKLRDECNDSEVVALVTHGKMPLYALEKHLGDTTRAVIIRRRAIAQLAKAPGVTTDRVPWKLYDYDRVFGACCENVIGYIPLPLGIAGPLIIDGVPYHIPMATTEGCLVASATRGCKAINAGGGVETVLTTDGMTRGPCVRFNSLTRAGAAKRWLDSDEGQKTIKAAFNSTSRFARLQHARTALAGTLLFIRFKTTTGDAMGMNMISKGVEHVLKYMQEECGFEDMDIISLSGNYCTDKKPAAINWIEGRGKSVVASATIPSEVVKKVLKSDVDALVKLNIDKNLVGSAMAGSIGGCNAQAANLVTALYLATGQDPAQNVESSNCITLMEKMNNGDLCISVSMPSIEVGTIGGGTILEPQGAMLDLLGVRGPNREHPGENARQLAKIVASIVLAAELSLCSALAAGHLVRAHMQHNRNSRLAAKPAAKPATSAKSSEGSKKEDANLKRLKQGSKICIKS